ncbi:MAG: DJ-1/PfpI family protein [bacterium]|nr:DJ-1/PfpI family protein [bacterium]
MATTEPWNWAGRKPGGQAVGKVLCFFSKEMADFEITLLFHKIKTVSDHEIVTVGYDLEPLVSESGLTYLPNQTISQVMAEPDTDALIIPGGSIFPQREGLTQLIKKLDSERKLLAAICNGPQYLGPAGVLDTHRFTTSNSRGKIRALNVTDPFPWEKYVDKRVVLDRRIITAKGRAFVDFTFAVCDYLGFYDHRMAERDRLYADIVNRPLSSG